MITGDKDFGEWIFLRGKSQPPLIRLTAMSPKNQKEVVQVIIEKYSGRLKKGVLITVDKNRIRIREKK